MDVSEKGVGIQVMVGLRTRLRVDLGMRVGLWTRVRPHLRDTNESGFMNEIESRVMDAGESEFIDADESGFSYKDENGFRDAIESNARELFLCLIFM